MKIEQIIWTTPVNYKVVVKQEDEIVPQLVMLFGDRNLINKKDYFDKIRTRYTDAYIIGCSTAGEIFDSQVLEDTIISTAIRFEHTSVENVFVEVDAFENSYNIGGNLARKLKKDKLCHVFVLSEGLNVNGSELVKGLQEQLPSKVHITGGFAADGTLFENTVVVSNEYAKSNIITAVGFYGDRIRIGYGSVGGWDSFGPERLITKSKGNILYELDGKSALDLYKLYLGEYAEELPASGILFPLSIRHKYRKEGLVRSLLKINEKDQGMFFAGDVPEGQYAKLMKANIDRLVNGAFEAAEQSAIGVEYSPELAILISCVGRKAVLKQRIEEEIEVVREVLGEECIFSGFYSYGEICPYKNMTSINDIQVSNENYSSEFHNQTMTITTIKEI